MALTAAEIVTRYEEAKRIRAPFENDFRLAAAHCMPRSAMAWNMTGPDAIAMQTARTSFDSTGARSLPKYVSILNRLITPENQKWATLQASNSYLRALRPVKEYFEVLNDKLFRYRYAPRAGFVQAVGEMYGAIGVYGTGPLGVTWRKGLNGIGGFSYKAWPLRDIFLATDDEGRVDTIFRRFWLNARNFKRKFPDAEPPPAIAAELQKPSPSETTFYEFVHYIHPRDDFNRSALDNRRHALASRYVSVEGKMEVGEEGGYSSLPILTPRVFTEAGEVYGYSPAMQAIPALGGVSAQKKTMLKQGHKAVDPVILAHDDGVLSGRVDLRPGRVNYGGVDHMGRKLIQALDTGANFNVAEALLQDERKDIEDSFFVTLFQILTETPEMTATEVIERVAEKASLLAPTMGRMHTEFAGPLIEREIELLAENGELPEMPPELQEADGDYEVQYTSPMAKGMKAEEISGFLRWRALLMEEAAAKGDPSALDWIDTDAAAPELAEQLSVPVRWVATKDKVEEKRKGRADAQENAELMQNAPAIASVATAAMKQGEAA